jgi:peptidoglycan/xylan/chitin deacetylase (PgdA/CDA1 family)
MSATLQERLRKAWHIYRRRQKQHAPKANRLVVSKAHWLNDARSPVVLMIDDLTNAWHDRGKGPRWEHGGDWGGARRDPSGAIAFLEKQLLADFPEARTTFFVVAGQISAYTHHQPFSFAAPMDASAESRAFFTELERDPRYELAYHGFNHGSAGEVTEKFLQEWRGFPSRAAAIEQTHRGLEIFERAAGNRPRGGKYGGWDYNEHAGDAVSDLGFLWWCRDWMPRDTTDSVDDGYYEPQYFGANLVVALPTTVHGYFWDRRQVDLLLERRQVVSIEEHIAPVRPDGLVQTPNIVDDIHELRKLYAYLRGHNVWHANCTDIAAYASARDFTTLSDVSHDGFSVRYTGRFARPPLTLYLDSASICSTQAPDIEVTAPDGAPVPPGNLKFDRQRFRHRVTIPVQDGRYAVRAVRAPGHGGD